MVTIYCIEDINDLKYVGSTSQKLNRRLNQHRCRLNCSSSKLNLHNCIIFPLETCDESNRKEREKYWINKIDCVNVFKLNFSQREWRENNREYSREWYKNNKEKRSEYTREWYKKNKEKKREYSREYRKKKKLLKTSQSLL